MSEPTSETSDTSSETSETGETSKTSEAAEAGSGTGGGTEEHTPPEVGLIGDDELPDDLDPAENPLARDPDDDEPEQTVGPGADAAAQGMGDMGQPGS